MAHLLQQQGRQCACAAHGRWVGSWWALVAGCSLTPSMSSCLPCRMRQAYLYPRSSLPFLLPAEVLQLRPAGGEHRAWAPSCTHPPSVHQLPQLLLHLPGQLLWRLHGLPLLHTLNKHQDLLRAHHPHWPPQVHHHLWLCHCCLDQPMLLALLTVAFGSTLLYHIVRGSPTLVWAFPILGPCLSPPQALHCVWEPGAIQLGGWKADSWWAWGGCCRPLPHPTGTSPRRSWQPSSGYRSGHSHTESHSLD